MQTQPLVHLVADDEVKGEAKKLFEQIKSSTGKVPKWMRVMANCEDTLVGFFMLFKSVMDNTPTNKLLKWKIAYVVSDINKCEFCVSITKIQLKNLGLNEKDIPNIEVGCSDEECIAIEYAKATTKHAYKVDSKLFAKMKKHFTDEQIVEITAVIGLFNFINRFNDALGVLPDIK